MGQDVVRRARGESRRQEILEAALEEFSQRGLDGVSVEDIANRVGCNKSLVYYYFGTKEGLRDAVMSEMVRVNEAEWAGLRSNSFAGWVRALTDWSRTHPHNPWVRLAVREGLSDTGSVLREAERSRTLGESTRVVVRAQGSGEIDPELDPEFVSLLLLFLTIGPAVTPQMVRMLTGDNPGEERFRERYTAFIDELVARLAPRGRAEASQ